MCVRQLWQACWSFSGYKPQGPVLPHPFIRCSRVSEWVSFMYNRGDLERLFFLCASGQVSKWLGSFRHIPPYCMLLHQEWGGVPSILCLCFSCPSLCGPCKWKRAGTLSRVGSTRKHHNLDSPSTFKAQVKHILGTLALPKPPLWFVQIKLHKRFSFSPQFFRRNCSICRCWFLVSIEGDEFRVFLCCHFCTGTLNRS